LQVVPNSVSLSALRRKVPEHQSLSSFFSAAFGPADSKSFSDAQQNFVHSMAAYSVICYILQIKDRHDGNILLLRDGSIVHIDYGYMLGRRMNEVLEFENAPFKLKTEWVDVMGGQTGAAYQQFLALCIRGFCECLMPVSSSGRVRSWLISDRDSCAFFHLPAVAARKHSVRFMALARSMQIGSTLPCLEGGEKILQQLHER